MIQRVHRVSFVTVSGLWRDCPLKSYPDGFIQNCYHRSDCAFAISEDQRVCLAN